MNKNKDIFVSFITLFSLAGIFFLSLSGKYIFNYFQEFGSSVRHEYLEGATLVTLAALPCWLIVSILAMFIHKEIPKYLYVTLNIPVVVLGLGFIYSIAYIILKQLII